MKQTCLDRYGDENYNNPEKRKETCLEKYGKETFLQTDECIQRTIEHNRKLFGVDHYSQSQEYLEKIIKTNRERYGVDFIFMAPEVKEKIRQTLLERYGVDHFSKSPLFMEKFSATCQEKYNNDFWFGSEAQKNYNLEKYGVEHFMQTKSFKEKSRVTSQRKYGVPFYAQTQEFKNRSMQTCLEKYGYPFYSQSPEAARNRRKKYYYKGQSFDSSWELAYYVYNVDNNNYIIREPISIKYVFENKEHYYIPDFMVNGRLIEIKGPQFFKEGKMICPFDESLNDTFEAKHQCMIKNNVEIIMNCDKYIQYITEKYGQDFLDNCKD